MKSLVRILSFFLCLIVGTEPASAESIKPSVRVTAILPLSGELAVWGNRIRRGMELAVARESPAHVKLTFDDAQIDAARSVAAFHRAVATSDVIIVFSSGIGHALGPLAERAEIPLIAVCASDPAVGANKRFVFTHWVSPEAEAERMVDEVIQRKYRTIVAVLHDQEGINAIAGAFKEGLVKRTNLNVSFEHTLTPETTDFRTGIAKLKATSADGILALLWPHGLAAFARQAREAGVKAEIFGADTFEDPEIVAASSGALEGAWYAIGSSGVDWFQDAYRQRYKEDSPPSACNGYDVVRLVTEAVNNSVPNKIRIAEHLRTVKNFEGACGTYGATGDSRFALPAVVKTIRGTGFEETRR